MTLTYGNLRLNNGHWIISCEPHVTMMAKRIFKQVRPDNDGLIVLKADPETSRDLQWFTERYPLACDHPEELKRLSAEYQDRILALADIIDTNYKPKAYKLALPPRDYQRLAADWILRTKQGLLGDQVGTGKTISAICPMVTGKTLPAVVICPTHIQRQWKAEIDRFAPDLRVHIIKKGSLYDLPEIKGRGPDVLVINYHKLEHWAPVLAAYCKYVVFDEAQELRRAFARPNEPTKKYAAAKQIAEGVEYRLGLSGTPILNFGGEIFNVMNVLTPGRLGDWEEFQQEWCYHDANGDRSKVALKNPEAFGSWLRAEYLMLRRTRKDIGRELDDLTRVTLEVDADQAALDRIEGKAGELARILLKGTGQTKRGEKMHASSEFSNVLRQATGISKAPAVASYVQMLVESGESVVLFGWHIAVYAIWMAHLKDYDPAFYTGEQSVSQKDAAVRRFVSGQTKIFICSLRAGQGLDGLQKVSSTCVFGELDWSPGIHEQCIGRLQRDGQESPVTAYFLVSEGGIDPIMRDTLGLKGDQVQGIRADGDVEIEQRMDPEEAIQRLAQRYAALRKAGGLELVK